MIYLKSRTEIDKMSKAGKLTATVLGMLANNARVGVSTKELNDLAYNMIYKEFKEAKASFLNYNGFPGCICTSINEEIVHGIPKASKVLKNGDIISFDCGVFFEGFHGDSAVTIIVGEVGDEVKKLVDVTKKSLDIAIELIRPGIRLGDVANAIQSYVEENGFSVVRDFVGHGIGRLLHEEPEIPNFGEKGTGVTLKEGMTLAIEPMVCMGKASVKILKNMWTAVSMDNSLSAHFEHTVAVTSDGAEILTKI